MAAEKIIQIALAGGESGWGTLYALSAEGQIFCLDTGSMKEPSKWVLVDGPDFTNNVELRDDQKQG